jgi:hypothetical protein
MPSNFHCTQESSFKLRQAPTNIELSENSFDSLMIVKTILIKIYKSSHELS